MCKSSVEIATSNMFNLAELWFKQLTYTSEDPVTDPFAADSGGRTLTSQGAANKPNLRKNCEGENKVVADEITSKSFTNLAPMTGRKRVSSEDMQSRITKPSLSQTNKGYHIKMPKLVHLLQSRFCCSERIRKSQDAKEAE